MKRTCNMSEMNPKTYDGRWHHPFTCLVAGPTQSGKSMFVCNLLQRQGDLIDVIFDYVLIVMGTERAENKTLSAVGGLLSPVTEVQIIEIPSLYKSTKEMIAKFPMQFREHLQKRHAVGKCGCVVFDDLMGEMAQCGLLLDLFSKVSSHYGVSIVHITQNLFHRTGSKSDNVTIYRNTHVLVLFHNPMDSSVLSNIAHRINHDRAKNLTIMLSDIVQKHRYVVLHGDFNRPHELRFMSDIFATHPVHHQRAFSPLTGRNMKLKPRKRKLEEQ